MSENPLHDLPELHGPTGGKRSFFTILFSIKTLVIATALLVIFHSVMLVFVGWEHFTQSDVEDPEVALGTYRYEARDRNSSDWSAVEFHMHVGLLTEVDRVARHLMRTHRQKVQQSVEELLREAQDDEFHDPKLTEIKRRLQETINATLGERVIAEVILTGVVFERFGEQDVSRQIPNELAEPGQAVTEVPLDRQAMRQNSGG